MTDTHFLFYSFDLVVAVFAVKFLALRYIRNKPLAAIVFVFGVLCAIPVIWALCPDWGKIYVAPIANWVGSPISLLTVPIISFLVDLFSENPSKRQILSWRILIEVFIAAPAWFLFWIFFIEFGVLNWVWI